MIEDFWNFFHTIYNDIYEKVLEVLFRISRIQPTRENSSKKKNRLNGQLT
jgi:hypothetical protein